MSQSKHERIHVHAIKLDEANAWLASKTRDGRLVDPRVYVGVQLARQRQERK